MLAMVSSEFMSMIETVVGWAIAFIVVYAIVYAMGIRKDTLKQATLQLDLISKKLVELAGKVNSDSPSSSNEEMIKDFRQTSKKVMKTKKHLEVYLYDHGENTEVSGAISNLVKSNASIKSSAISLAESKLSVTEERLLGADKQIQTSLKLLQKAVKKNESEKLVKI